MKIKTKINFAALFEKSNVIVPELWRLRQEDYQFKASLTDPASKEKSNQIKIRS
jgi:hypothetical protein